MTYTYEQVKRASVEYFNGDELAADVFASKYALRVAGELVELTPKDMHRRLAREFARVENQYPNPMSEDDIFDLLDAFRYIVPQGSPMNGIGNVDQVQSLSNCFVIAPPADSYGSIARADEEILQIQKRRGGVGVDISNIRPRGVEVKNAAATSDGIGIFMERFSNTTREVAQGGRRGALMQTIDVRHPDVEQFITIKQDLKKVTGANVSVRVNDEFMQSVVDDAQFELKWPVTAETDSAKVKKTVPARRIWDTMMNAAWTCAEPGVLFWDTALRLSMADEFADKGFKTVCTNPCAELMLSIYDSCRLLLVNVVSYVTDPFTEKATFDFDLFSMHAFKAQRLMDDLVDLELEAIDRIITKVQSDDSVDKERELSLWSKIRMACANGRRTGTGLTAVGDAIAALGLRYGSAESIEFVERLYMTFAGACHTSSVAMAIERGPFPAWEQGRYLNNEFADRLKGAVPEHITRSFELFGRRNIALTTTAPAGSVSVLTQTTSGIEPVYQPSYKRRKKLTDAEISEGARVDFIDQLGDRWQEYVVYHPGVAKWMQVTGHSDVEGSPYANASSADVDWVASIDLLAAAAKWTEHSISKTVNLPSTATRELVSEVYMRAWRSGIKGLTVYRDGSRTGVLITDQPQSEKPDQLQKIVANDAPKRPKELECDVHRVTVKGQQYLVIVGLLSETPYEVFAGLSEHVEMPKKTRKAFLIKNGKKDGVATYNLRIPIGDGDDLMFKDIVERFDNPEHGALTRMISLSMRHGVPVQYLVEQLRKDRHSDLQSFSTVIARVLKNYIKDGTKVTAEKTCQACGSTNLKYEQGCSSCVDCGSSKCA